VTVNVVKDLVVSRPSTDNDSLYERRAPDLYEDLTVSIRSSTDNSSLYERRAAVDVYGSLVASTRFAFASTEPIIWNLPLPQDIMYLIIDTYFLHNFPDPDLNTLYNLARTARCLTSYCRSVIYRKIALTGYTRHDETMVEIFARILSGTPEIAHYIHDLRITDTGSMFQFSVPLPEVEQSLKYIVTQEFPNLRRVEVNIPVGWTLLPASLTHAFEVLFQARTIQEIVILRGRIPPALLQEFRTADSVDIRALVSYPDGPMPRSENTCPPTTLTIVDKTPDGETTKNLLHHNSPLRIHRLTELRFHGLGDILDLINPTIKARQDFLTSLTIHAASVQGE